MLFKTYFPLMLLASLLVTGCFDSKDGTPQSSITSPTSDAKEPAPVRVGSLEKLEVSPVAGITLNPNMGWLQLTTKATETVVQTNSLLQKTGNDNSNGNGNSGNGNAGNDNSGPGNDDDEFEVSAINVLVKEVSARKVNTEEWILVSQESRAINLLNLNNDAKDFFANNPLTPGSYDQIRIKIDKSATTTIDAKVVPLEVPSGATSGIKMKGLFSIEKGYLTKISFVIDGKKSVVRQNKNKYSLRPVINIDGVAEDLFPPLLAIVTPTSQITKVVSHSVAIEYSDDFLNLSSLSILIDGVEAKSEFQITDSSAVAQKTFSEGTHTIQAKISDKPGYTTVTEPVTLVVDLSAPVITFGHQSGVELPTASFTLNINISDLTSVESKVSLNGVQVQTSNLKVFQVPLTLVPGANNIKVESTDQVGNSATATTVLMFDITPPVLSYILPESNKKYYTKSWPLSVQVKVASNEILLSAKVNDVESALSFDFLSFGNIFSFTEPGTKIITATAKDMAGNQASLDSSIDVIFDDTPPIISTDLVDSFLTSQPLIYFNVKVQEPSPTITHIFAGATELMQTSSKDFVYQAYLPLEGNNILKITSVDAAGNASSISKIIVRDTTLPLLSNIVPANGALVRAISFSVSGKSNEPLISASVNGMDLILSNDHLSFSGSYLTQTIGEQTLQWVITDLAGNVSTFNSIVKTDNTLLVPTLVSAVPDKDGIHVDIVGAIGAARAGTEVRASVGIFGFNRDSAIVNPDGSFFLQLNQFTSADLTVTDTNASQSQTMIVTFDGVTILSGVVKDTNDVPLKSARVSLAGASISTLTDENGNFTFQNPPFGSQDLVIDGTGIPQAVTGSPRQFSIAHIRVNIGFGQTNVMPKPIFLSYIKMDGTQTTVSSTTTTTVTSSDDPNLSLSIPKSTAIFPPGVTSTAVSVAVIDSSRSTIPVPASAIPDKVVSLEPSGMQFTKRVQLTLSNENEFPEGSDLIILSMNSSKGQWEVDGLAKVDPGGQTLTTTAGNGISHFSLVYAVPVRPVVTTVGDPKLVGIDSSKGGLETSIEVPSFKSLGQPFKLGLKYKSTWARPTALISNMIDVPDTKVSIQKEFTQEASQIVTVRTEMCNWLNECDSSYKDYYLRNTAVTEANYVRSIIPDSVSSQFYVSGISTGEVVFDQQSPSTSGDLPGSLPASAIKSTTTNYSGLPHRAFMSYGMELKNPIDGKFLSTGIYPSLARYQLKLKHMTIVSSTTTQTSFINGDVQNRTVITNPTETQVISQVIPQDLTGNVIVQNKAESSYGTGWKLNLAQKILNPNSNQIIIEEPSGELSSYVINQSITTVYNGNTSDAIDLTGAVDLRSWPIIGGLKHTPSRESAIYSLDALSGTGSNLGNIFQYSGTIDDATAYKCTSTSNTYEVHRYSYNYLAMAGGLLVSPDGSAVIADSRQHLLGRLSGGTYSKLTGASEAVTFALGYWGNSQGKFTQLRTTVQPPEQMSQFCTNKFGVPCVAQGIVSEGNSCVGVNSSTGCIFQFNGSCGLSGRESGPAGLRTFNGGLSQPSQIVSLLDGSILVADTGHNRLVRVDNLNVKTIFAGTGANYDFGDGGDAKLAGINQPVGLAVSSEGSVFVSTSGGLIRKIDGNGNISTVSGMAVTDGGLLNVEAPIKLATFNQPTYMVFDNENNWLYVSDTGNHRVMRLDFSTGMAIQVAGNGQCLQSSGADGQAALSTSICNPASLGLDDQRNLLIVDKGEKLIRRVNFGSISQGVAVYSSTNNDLSKLSRNNDGTWIRTARSGDKAIFDSLGKQTSQVDRVGRSVLFSYDSADNLISVSDPVGQVVRFDYSGNKLSAIRDPIGRSTLFGYSGNNLTQVVFPNGTQRKFEYDNKGLLVKEYDQLMNPTEYTYNLWNRIASVKRADDSISILNDYTSAQASQGFITQQSALQSSGTEVGQAKDSIVDGNNNSVTVAKDINGFIESVKDPEGNITKYRRDFEGNLLSVTVPNGAVLSFTYDPNTRDMLTKTDSSTGITEKFQYDQYGNLISNTTGTGVIFAKTLDPITGLILSESRNNQITASYSYNSLGLLAQKTAFVANQTLSSQYIYDSRGNLLKQIGPDGKYSTLSYDMAGNTIELNNYKDNVTLTTKKYAYDEVNQLVKITTPNAEVIEYSYLPTGQMSQIKDPKGQLTLFEYDMAGRIKKKTDPMGFSHGFAYDLNGNVVQETDPNGIAKQFTYTPNGKLKQVILPEDLITYDYNANGELISVQGRSSSVVFTKDSEGRMLSSLVSGAGEMINYPAVEFDYSYDSFGNVKTITSNLGSQFFVYDALNRPKSLQTSSGSNFAFNYDDISRLLSVSRPGSRTDYTYGQGGMIDQIIHSSNGITKSFTQYSYDQRNMPIQKRNSEGVFNYSYDLNGQLTNVSSSGGASLDKNENFNYDSIGNRVIDQNGNYIYDSTSQRLKEDYQFFYSYDNNGNITAKIAKDQSKDSFSYSYSSSNQLTSIRINQGLSGAIKKEIRFRYDVLGRRIQKEIINNLQPVNSYTRKYIYNGDNIFAMYDGSNNLLAKFTHSPLAADDILETEITSVGVQSGLSRAAGKFQYLKDALGTVTDIADSNGNIVQRYEYSAYGKILKIKDGDANDISTLPIINTSFTYTGREWDEEAGLYYYRARYYDPYIGRFLQVDPDPGKIEVPSTFLSKYIYGVNAPTTFRDPRGMSIFGDFVSNLLDFGHHVIADFGKSFDMLIKNPSVQTFMIIVGSILLAPEAAVSVFISIGIGALVAGIEGNLKGNRSWESFTDGVKGYLSDPEQIRKSAILGLVGYGAAAIAGSYLGWDTAEIGSASFTIFLFGNMGKLDNRDLRLSQDQRVIGTAGLIFLGGVIF